ncbi:MAG: sugar transferase [Candidatus Paceibacterota bacterium]
MLKEIINKHKIHLVLLGDILGFYLSLFIMLVIRYGGEKTLEKFQMHLLPFTILLLIWLMTFYIIDLYSYTNINSTIENKKKLLISALINVVLSLGIFYIFGSFFSITPKTNLFIFIAVFTIIDYLWRHFFSWFLKQKYNNHKVLLISSSILNDSIIEHIEKHPQLGYSIRKCSKEELVGNTINYNEYTTIVVDNKSFADPTILKKSYNLVSKNIEIISLTDFYEKLLLRIPLDEIKEEWFINEIKSKNYINDNIKNIIDKLLAIIGIIALSPLLLVVVFLIKISSKGPAVYKQTRIGKNNKKFILYKFRTMFIDAEKNGAQWCSKNDPRTTATGQFLRNTHIDELPQLFNILKGDISFVGPRPERPEFVQILEKEIPHYLFRQMIRPGLTGWAQIMFRYARSVMDSKEKFEYDLFYIKNRNILLDFGIIIRTIQIIFTY